MPDAIPRNIQGMGSGVFLNNMEISWEVMFCWLMDVIYCDVISCIWFILTMMFLLCLKPLEYREWNGPKLGYMVWWRRRDSREEWKNYTTYWWCSYIIYDTDTFTPYEIKVQAVNFFGYGPESPVVIGYSGEDRKFTSILLTLKFCTYIRKRDVSQCLTYIGFSNRSCCRSIWPGSVRHRELNADSPLGASVTSWHHGWNKGVQSMA